MDFIAAIFLMLFVSCGGADKKAVATTAAEPQLPRAEFPAEFPTGPTGFNMWVIEHIQTVFDSMPEEEVMNCTHLQVNFLTKKDGRINNVQVLNEVSAASKQKMEAIFYKMPKWKPATLQGKPVDYLYKMSSSIHFQ